MDTYSQFMRHIHFLPPYSCSEYDDAVDRLSHTRKYPSESDSINYPLILFTYRLVVSGWIECSLNRISIRAVCGWIERTSPICTHLKKRIITWEMNFDKPETGDDLCQGPLLRMVCRLSYWRQLTFSVHLALQYSLCLIDWWHLVLVILNSWALHRCALYEAYWYLFKNQSKLRHTKVQTCDCISSWRIEYLISW